MVQGFLTGGAANCLRTLKIYKILMGALKKLKPISAGSKKSGLFNHTTFRPF
jgi:hypothetical protein